LKHWDRPLNILYQVEESDFLFFLVLIFQVHKIINHYHLNVKKFFETLPDATAFRKSASD